MLAMNFSCHLKRRKVEANLAQHIDSCCQTARRYLLLIYLVAT
jgi:hypothetical protein